jgi:4-amino-4-deoxy-L-arabinose transferase-like glycosyltransferase
MEDLTRAVRSVGRRSWPEIIVATLACFIFLGSLGSLELWGKREQRAAAEALDTVENGRWLVAEIQGRPRLEKPPLPRWTAAATMILTGRRDEWVLRLPCALSGLATVGLVYSLGRRMGGRGLGLASALILCTTVLFVSELRQAGNDGPLCFFTTLALYAAWRRLHGVAAAREAAQTMDQPEPRGARKWAILFQVSLGLGFLCKGPIILLLVGLTVIPFLLACDRLGSGLRLLTDGFGLILFLGLSLSWPMMVALNDPLAIGVWTTEMGQKTGLLPIGHQQRSGLALALPVLAVPWPVASLVGVLMPVVPSRLINLPTRPRAVAFVWWWSMGNLVMFSLWAVAKPSYFVPCLPGLALLMAMAWIRLCRVTRARHASFSARLAKGLLLVQYLFLLVCGVLAPLLSRNYFKSPPTAWLAIVGVLASTGVLVSYWIWRRGSDILPLLPIMTVAAIVVVIGYGAVGPVDNPARGHRHLAQRLERLIPPSIPMVRFFHEIDEGLWFYLREHRLAPVPGSQPRYSDSYDKRDSIRTDGAATALSADSTEQPQTPEKNLLDWVLGKGREEPFLLIRSTVFERVAPRLAGLVTPLYRETGLVRNGLVLLHVNGADLAAAPEAAGESPTMRR